MILERIENGPFLVNTFVLGCEATNRGILIDPGHDADTIGAAVESSGLTIEAVVNTHGHIDHVATVQHFKDALGVPFKMHPGDKPFLDHLPQQCAAYGLPEIPVPVVEAWLDAGQTVAVGNLSFTLRLAPGHSPGSVMFDFGDVMIVGDVIFDGSIGRTDLPLGDHQTLIESIHREVMVKNDAVVLHPGHGPATTVGKERTTNPFLTGRL